MAKDVQRLFSTVKQAKKHIERNSKRFNNELHVKAGIHVFNHILSLPSDK